MKKVAILGAGYCGLAIAWHLLNSKKDLDLTIFDRNGIGGAASGIGAGLLHPYGGLHAKLNCSGYEGYEATRKLIDVASNSIKMPVSVQSGILRIALTEEQKIAYRLCSEKYSDVDWLSAEQCQNRIAGLVVAPGIFIRSGITVYSDLYINGLWKACEKLGARLEKRLVHSLAALDNFDLIIVALGHNTPSLPELSHLKVNPVKGQLLELKWPKELPPLSVPLNSLAYLVMSEDNESCIAGSTYEREFADSLPNPEVAIADILPKVVELVPALGKATIIRCKAGIRASTARHHPLLQQINPKCWVLTGMGSKGLLYHALFAEKLVKDVLAEWY